MGRSAERILTTHTGSLPRPDDLTQMLRRRDDGDPVDGFDERVGTAVAQLVEAQLDAGLDVVNDGEAGKYMFATYVKDRLDGLGGASRPPAEPPPVFADFPEFMEQAMRDFVYDVPACVGPVTHRGPQAVRDEIATLQRALAARGAEADGFLSAASPGIIAMTLEDQHYGSHEEYVWALAEAMKPEYDEIHAAGLVLQLDCPDIPAGHDFSRKLGHGVRKVHIEALNHATRDIPPERMRIHLCWGNYNGPHNRDIPLADIIDDVLQARPAGISFEAANPRHTHEWRVFADTPLPDDKVLIPGVIDSTTNYIEHPRLVADHIVRYANLVGRERVVAGTDCGFATVAGLGDVHPTIAWAKLRALAEGAEIASRELYG